MEKEKDGLIVCLYRERFREPRYAGIFMAKVNDEKEAFYQIRKFLKASGIQSAITNIGSKTVYNEDLCRDVTAKLITTPISWWGEEDLYLHHLGGYHTGDSDWKNGFGYIVPSFSLSRPGEFYYETQQEHYGVESIDEFYQKYHDINKKWQERKYINKGDGEEHEAYICLHRYFNYILTKGEVI